jgi:site-specific recombinase XerD
MKKTDFAQCLETYLRIYLPGQAGLSENTIIAYRDTFIQMLRFIEIAQGINPDKLTLADITTQLVEEFLMWLESEKHNSISTRNQRLAAIRAFAKYARSRYPEFLLESQKISDIRRKKHPKPEIVHLSPAKIKAILDAVPTNDPYSRRDLALLTLLYDTAARVQEICDLRVRDIRLRKPYTAKLTGKGQKTRCVPLMDRTADILKKYVSENHLDTPDKLDRPFFVNHGYAALTRAGIAYILKKYCEIARKDQPDLPARISPHVLRHSKAMHMLQAGIPLTDIRDFLGHEHVDTTEIYAKTDIETRRKKLEEANLAIDTGLPDWNNDKDLIAMLTSLCGKNI